ncbi:hypothetical protein GUITHDRAFT_115465 [Guillardia theta CCMP2712]|uniref:Uncharacterized protein n=1 Tax=Guillardia theta (strain CCMP2712) TaxID=905079 RepID=L1IQI4_GUITC|nr:hypothetical protein GUITHDRAFT_115465 [Guillardia theta CCMP2712]EKX38317.1 hypothetical protein GUITHDRAFT_115465 [Guillardia theta CCMP2712]|eukprot:XP_005825297.1 hypothetical protein GUITHDRAFT_115465 [Guillardia theta CCMP2712]
MAQGLLACCRMEELDVGGNAIGCVGAAALSTSMEGMEGLRVLKLDGCDVGDGGCRRLGDSLSSRSGLEELHLNNNMIGEDAVSLLLRRVRGLESLRSVFLYGNKLDPIRTRRVAQETLGVSCSVAL